MEVDGFLFGCIVVRFSESNLGFSPDDMEQLLLGYMEYLKEVFEVTKSAGAGTGHTLESCPDARGVIDFLEDTNENQLAVKGWVNQKYLGFLYLSGAEEYPHFNLQ